MRRFYKTAAVAVLILILPLVFLAACEMIPQTQTTPCDQNGHQWSEGAVTAKPTCVVEGETLYTCTVEGCRGTKIEKIPALGHVADPDLTGKPVAPSCIEGGYLPQVCSVCKEGFKEYDGTEATDHSLAEDPDNEGNLAPTCKAEGIVIFACINGCGHTESRTVDKLEHVADPQKAGKPVAATCTEGGYLPQVCSVCKEGFKEYDGTEALGHDMKVDADHPENVAPTCFSKGNAVYVCANGCGETERRDVDEVEHTWDEGTVVSKSTCAKAGEKLYTCTVPECDGTKSEFLDKLTDHNWNSGRVTVKPTCAKEGVWTYSCMVKGCTATRTEPMERLTEHTWDSGVMTAVPTCKDEGERTFKCSERGCDATKKEVIPVFSNAHVYNSLVFDQKTQKLCDLCSVCGASVPVAYAERLPTYSELIAGNDVLCAENLANTAVGTTVSAEQPGNTQVKTFHYKTGSLGFILRENSLSVEDNGGVDGVGKYVRWNMKTQNSAYINHCYVSAVMSSEMGVDIVFDVALRLGEPDANGEYCGGDLQIIDRGSKAGSNSVLMLTFAKIGNDGTVSTNGNKEIVATLSKDKFTYLSFAIHSRSNSLDVYVDGKLVALNVALVHESSSKEVLDWSKFQIDEMRLFQYNTAMKVGLGSWMDIANLVVYKGHRPMAILGADDVTQKRETCYLTESINALGNENGYQDWLEEFFATSPDYAERREKYETSLSTGTGEKDGKIIPVVNFENFASGIGTLFIYNLQNFPKNAVTGNYDFSSFKTVVIDVYYHGDSDYRILFGLQSPNLSSMSGISYHSVNLTVKPGWNRMEIDLSTMGKARDPRIDDVSNLIFACVGWANGTGDGKAIDGHKFSIAGIYFDVVRGAVECIKPADGCDHKYEEVVVEPSAESFGYTKRVCSACGGEQLVDGSYVAHNHTEVTLPAVKATCTENGLTEGIKCSGCGSVLVAQSVIPATGHDVTGVDRETVIGDCLTDGYVRAKCRNEGCSGYEYYSHTPALGAHSYDISYDPDAKALKEVCKECEKELFITFAESLPAYTDMIEALGGKALIKFSTKCLELDRVYGGTKELGQVILGNGDKASGNLAGSIRYHSAGNTFVAKDNGGADGVGNYIRWNMKAVKEPLGLFVANYCYINPLVSAPAGRDVVFSFSMRLGEPGADGKYCGGAFMIIDRNSTAFNTTGNKFVNFMRLDNDGVLTLLSNGKKIVEFTQDKFINVAVSIHTGKGTVDVYVDGKLVMLNADLFDAGTSKNVTDWTKLEVQEIRGWEYGEDLEVGLGSWIDVADIAVYEGNRPFAITGVDYTPDHKCSAVAIDPVTNKLGDVCSVCGEIIPLTYADKLPAYADMIASLGSKVYVGLNTDVLSEGVTYPENGEPTLSKQLPYTATRKIIMLYCRGNSFVLKNNGGADGVSKYIQWNMKTVKEPNGEASNHCYINISANAPAGEDVVFSFSLRLGMPDEYGRYPYGDFQLIDRNCSAFGATVSNQFLNTASFTYDGAITLKSTGKKVVQFTRDRFTNVAFVFHCGKGTVDAYVDGKLVVLGADMFDSDVAARITSQSLLQLDELRIFQYNNDTVDGLGSWVDIANVCVYSGYKPVAVTGADINDLRSTTGKFMTVNNSLGGNDAYAEWLEEFKLAADDIKVDRALSVGSIEKDGQQIPVILYTNFSSEMQQVDIYNIKGFTKDEDTGCYDLSAADSVILEIYNHGESPYMICFGLRCPDNNGLSYFGKDKVVVAPGWNRIEFTIESMNQNRGPDIKNIKGMFIATGGWFGGIIDSTTGKGSGKPVDGYTFSIVGIYFKKLEAYIDLIAPIEGCKHDFSEEVTVAPSTDAFGYTKRVCSVCGGEQLVEDSYVEHIHTEVTDAAVDATCTESGLTAGSHCSACGKVLIAQSIIPATGHAWDEGEVTKLPTCGAVGVNTFTCSACGATETEDIPADGPHSWGAEEVTKQPSCGVGEMTSACTVCGQTRTVDIPGTGEHTWNEGEITVQPNCGKGEKICVCNICGETKTEDVPGNGEHIYDGTLFIDPVTHKLGETCSICGSVKALVYTDKLPAYADMIASLGDKVINGFNTDGFEDGVVYAGTVDNGVGTPLAKDIKYDATNKTIRLYMAGNSAVIKDNGGADGVNKYVQWNMKTVRTPEGFASNHCYINVNTYAPAGADVVFSFSLRLGTPDANGKYVPGSFDIIDRNCTAFDGVAANKYLAPMTFTQDGGITIRSTGENVVQFSRDKFTNVAFAFHCSKGTMDVYVDGKLVALGVGIFDPNVSNQIADWSRFQIDEFRTCQYMSNTTYGIGSWIDIANITTYKADRPAAITGIDYESFGIEEHIHTEVTDTAVEATCTETGLTEGKHCSVCGEILVAQNIIPATGHAWNEGEITTQPTCIANGERTYACTGCGEIKTEEVLASGVHEYTLVVLDTATGALCDSCSGCGALAPISYTDKLPTWKETLEALNGNGAAVLGAENLDNYTVDTKVTASATAYSNAYLNYGTRQIRLALLGNSLEVKDNGGADCVDKYIKWQMQTEENIGDSSFISINARADVASDMVFELAIRLGEPGADGNYGESYFHITDRNATCTEASGNLTLNFLKLNADGTLSVLGNGSVVQLDRQSFTKLSFAIHSGSNIMDVYVDGMLVAFGIDVFADGDTTAVTDWSSFQVDEIRVFQYSTAESSVGLGSVVDIANMIVYGGNKPIAIVGVEG